MPDYTVSGAVFDDDRWIDELQVTRKSEASNESGYAIDSDTSTETIRALVRPARARWWRQVSEGISTTGEYVMIVENSEPVSQGDEVEYKGDTYTVAQVDVEYHDGFSVYEIEPVTT
jgi:hypothetical protein